MRNSTKTLKRARKLRKELSLPEAMLWTRLRQRLDGKPVFRRQHPMGPFILDFFCAKAKLVIEVDGECHSARLAQDQSRDAWLKSQGVDVVRLGAVDVLQDPDGVAEAVIYEARKRMLA